MCGDRITQGTKLSHQRLYHWVINASADSMYLELKPNYSQGISNSEPIKEADLKLRWQDNNHHRRCVCRFESST